MAYLESNKLNQAAAVSAAKELQEEAEREKRAASILRESHSDPGESRVYMCSAGAVSIHECKLSESPLIYLLTLFTGI